jgi:CRISPR/Cas system-associated endonuclease Cas3-HD
MERYDPQQVEMMLRNYTSLSDSNDTNLMAYKVDLDTALKKLKNNSTNLYTTIVGVFISGNQIQEQAKLQEVSKRQTIRRMDDGLYMLTMIMNGDVL